MILQLVYRE